jgi:hypothetical protein
MVPTDRRAASVAGVERLLACGDSLAVVLPSWRRGQPSGRIAFTCRGGRVRSVRGSFHRRHADLHDRTQRPWRFRAPIPVHPCGAVPINVSRVKSSPSELASVAMMLVQPMRLDVLRDGPGPVWDRDLQAVGGTVFHSTVWARYVEAQQPHVDCLFVRLADDTGQTRGMALAFRTVWPREPLPPLSRSLWLDALPVVAGPDPEPLLIDFLRQLKSLAERAADVDLRVGSFASPEVATALRGLGFDCVRRLEFVRPLDVSEESLWAALGSKARNTLRKASRLGVTIHELAGEEAARELRRLQRASAGRIAARGGPQLVFPGGGRKDPVTILLDAGVGRILAARLEGVYVSAALFTRFNGLVYYTLAGHSEAGLRSQAPTLLLWEAIKRYREEGAHTFNLGGCAADAADEHSPEHGLYAYKDSLASHRVECTSGSVVLRRQVYRVVSGLRRAAAVLRHA